MSSAGRRPETPGNLEEHRNRRNRRLRFDLVDGARCNSASLRESLQRQALVGTTDVNLMGHIVERRLGIEHSWLPRIPDRAPNSKHT